MTCFKVLSQNFPRGTEENHKNLIEDSQCLGQDSHVVLAVYEAGVPMTHPKCSFFTVVVG
jgi:hypothetical protein